MEETFPFPPFTLTSNNQKKEANKENLSRILGQLFVLMSCGTDSKVNEKIKMNSSLHSLELFAGGEMKHSKIR